MDIDETPTHLIVVLVSPCDRQRLVVRVAVGASLTDVGVYLCVRAWVPCVCAGACACARARAVGVRVCVRAGKHVRTCARLDAPAPSLERWALLYRAAMLRLSALRVLCPTQRPTRHPLI
jgi:hypothetical protein